MTSTTSALAAVFAAAALLAFPTKQVEAHEPTAPAVAPEASRWVDPQLQAALAVVDQFGAALARGDLKTVERLLDPAVLILESGGAERSRTEYMGHHAIADAAFLAGARIVQGKRVARIDGTTAWVGSESELHATKNGVPQTLLSTETMILNKQGGDWRIVHIHWSSRPKQPKAPK